MQNRWWVTRPKRNLVSVPLCLAVLAHHANGKVWHTPNNELALAVEKGLEDAGVKRAGKRRDQRAGGARTYRSWMKSLGLIFMDDEGRFWTTKAGEALLNSEPPLEILKKQVLMYQYPSSFTHQGRSKVHERFKIRPFIFLLQLLLDERLEGYLLEKEEIGKIVIAYAETNSAKDVDKVVDLILRHRVEGDSMLDDDYLDKYINTSSARPATLEKLFAQHGDIANTLGNWLGYTQLIQRENGKWFIPGGVEDEVRKIVDTYAAMPLLKQHENEEVFQRRYGLAPGQSKDTRSLGEEYASRTATQIEEDAINLVMLELSSTRLITEVNRELVEEVANRTGSTISMVERTLSRRYPNGAVDSFMNSYVQLAFDSREHATEFELATAEIFRQVFGFNAQQMGQQGRRPDIVISSDQESYAGIIDNKAYRDGYSITHNQQNSMRTYIETYPKYKIDQQPLRFFCYVVSDYKRTINSQIKEVADKNHVPGSAITARDIIRFARMKNKPSHAQFLEMLTSNKVVDVLSLE